MSSEEKKLLIKMDFDLSKLVRFRVVIIFSLSEREQTRGRNYRTATHLINFETLIGSAK
jgi:hypothetical protein